jgi:predicted dithiol-disulfide oxidoreductase (DUF899 family)
MAMKTSKNRSVKPIALPRIVSRGAWSAARRTLLREEKASTRRLDALAARRRRLPMVLIDKPYVFKGPRGKLSLLDMFERRRQLILYHFMYAPGVGGWPSSGCPGCSMCMDQVGHLAHFHARDTSFCAVSVGPLARLLAFRKRMGWTFPWYSSAGSDFNADFGLSTKQGETFGLSVFIRNGDKVYRTYFTDGRGVEALGSVWTFLDVTPYGRQEKGEDSPAGWPQTPPFQWWRRHDEYAKR